MPDHRGRALDLDGDRAALAALAAEARSRLGSSIHDLRVGAAHIRVEFIGRALWDRLGPALNGLTATSPTSPTGPGVAGAPATLTVWDMTSTAQRLPPLTLLPDPGEPARSTHLTAPGPDGRPAVSCWFQPLEAAISLHDHRDGAGYFVVRDAGRLPAWESAAPLRAPLRWSLADQGLHLVHAASVGVEGRGVLLPGQGGSGKSTTTALCALAGLQTTGDDYVVLDPGARTVHALYRTVKLAGGLVERLVARPPGPGAGLPAGFEAGHGKRAYWLDEVAPGSLVGTLAVAAVLAPRVAGLPATRFTPASPAEALRRLAPSTLLQLPGGAESAFAAMRSLVDAVPVFVAELGRDLDRIPGEFEGFLAGLSPGSVARAC
jgi:hypothetical protein